MLARSISLVFLTAFALPGSPALSPAQPPSEAPAAGALQEWSFQLAPPVAGASGVEVPGPFGQFSANYGLASGQSTPEVSIPATTTSVMVDNDLTSMGRVRAFVRGTVVIPPLVIPVAMFADVFPGMSVATPPGVLSFMQNAILEIRNMGPGPATGKYTFTGC